MVQRPLNPLFIRSIRNPSLSASNSHLVSLFLLACFWVMPVNGATPTGAQPVKESVDQSVEMRVDLSRHIRKLPATLLGFNIHYLYFQDDLTNGYGVARPDVIDALSNLPGVMYRYPGGLVANQFDWRAASGPQRLRGDQRAAKWVKPQPVRFGPDEYLNFVRSVGGAPWYVLNLRGWDSTGENWQGIELPLETMVASNVALAKKMRAALGPDATLFFELGNELDRADYEWSHAKYIARSRANIDAIRAQDPNTRFVAFLRDFPWRYRDQERQGQVSNPQKFIQEVLRALPEVNDISLHYYYDDPGMEDRKTKWIPWRLNLFNTALATAQAERAPGELKLWVTEHARGVNLTQPKPMKRIRLTSNLQGAISSSDFLIHLAGIPAVQGAALHGLNAGPWQVFDHGSLADDGTPRPTYEALRLLAQSRLPTLVHSSATGPNNSGYGGGYDINVAAMVGDGSAVGDAEHLNLWVVNRANRDYDSNLVVPNLAGRKAIMRFRSLHAPKDDSLTGDTVLAPNLVRADGGEQTVVFDSKGCLSVPLPPLSVNTISLQLVSTD